LQTDGGLRHVQPVSGAGEAELFGDGYEIAELPSIKCDTAVGDWLGKAGTMHSINAQGRVKRAAPHILRTLQHIGMGCDCRVLDIVLSQLASQVVFPKISVEHRASSGYCNSMTAQSQS
jgi:hypothetical protein